ncbi:MAG: DUF4395 domain-containing protein [Chitinophagaceae bacterium]|nr:DUF4395 domain-containing protein [Chitinophagaceae bacterium]
MRFEPVCPVDFVKVDEKRVRFTAFWVLLPGTGFLVTGYAAVWAVLAVDFFLRAARLGKFSPFNILSGFVTGVLGLVPKPVDQSPKRFAASVGFVFSFVLFFVTAGGFQVTAIVLTGLLLLFAFLESALGFCVGCYIYYYYKRFLFNTKLQKINPLHAHE